MGLVVADMKNDIPDSKVHVAHMGLTWVPSAPGGPHVGPMNLAIRDVSSDLYRNSTESRNRVTQYSLKRRLWFIAVSMSRWRHQMETFSALSPSHTGSYNFVIVRLLAILSGKTSRMSFLRPENAIVSCDYFWGGRRTDRTTRRAIVLNWKISVAGRVVDNRTTCRSDVRLIARLVIETYDWSHDQS